MADLKAACSVHNPGLSNPAIFYAAQWMNPAPLNRLLSRMVADMKPPEGIQFVIDIDPIEML